MNEHLVKAKSRGDSRAHVSSRAATWPLHEIFSTNICHRGSQLRRSAAAGYRLSKARVNPTSWVIPGALCGAVGWEYKRKVWGVVKGLRVNPSGGGAVGELAPQRGQRVAVDKGGRTPSRVNPRSQLRRSAAAGYRLSKAQRTGEGTVAACTSPVERRLGLYTRLSIPILYGVCHQQGGSGEVIYCATVAQSYCSSMNNANGRGNTGMLDSCTHKNK